MKNGERLSEDGINKQRILFMKILCKRLCERGEAKRSVSCGWKEYNIIGQRTIWLEIEKYVEMRSSGSGDVMLF